MYPCIRRIRVRVRRLRTRSGAHKTRALRGAFALGNPTLEARASGFLVWRVRGVAALAAGCSRVRGVSSRTLSV